MPSSVAMRRSSSARQLRESRSQSRLVGGRFSGQGVERGADALERNAGGPSRLHERDPAQGEGRIAALVAAAALGGDEALALVEAQRGLRDAAARRELSDGQFASHP